MSWFTRKSKVVKATLTGEYFASHPSIKGHFKSLEIVMTDEGVEVVAGKKAKRRVLHMFSWDEITGFDAEYETETRNTGQRLTATRMVVLGVFSLAAPKSTGKLSTQFVSALHTTSGDLVLEEGLSGDASSRLTNMTSDLMKQHRRNIRAFVAERAKGGELQ